MRGLSLDDDRQDEERPRKRVRWATHNTLIRYRKPPDRGEACREVSAVFVGIASVERSLDCIECRSELDNHADCCVLGSSNALEIMDFGRPMTVGGFDRDASKQRTCRTISGVVAYDAPDGVTWMLVFHQSVLVEGLRHNLLCSAQMRDVGIRVNDEPKHTVLNPTNQHHAITVFENDDNGNRQVKLCIPLSLSGMNPYFPSRVPTREEFDTCPPHRVIDMTDEHTEWRPRSDRLRENEEAMTKNGFLPANTGDGYRNVSAVLCDLPGAPMKQPESALASALESTVRVSGVQSTRDKRMLRPEHLVHRWGVSIEKATRTLEATTHRLVRSTLHPHLSRRYGTNDRGVRYNRLSDDVFTDTLKANVKSYFRKNRYVQIFATRKGFCRAYPMEQKGQAHEALSLFASREGVPPNFVMDGAKEQVHGEFSRKMRQMQAGKRQIEPHSPWQNEAEATIREVKRGADRKMTKMKSPIVLWDHCLELECLIRSSTWRNSVDLEGQVPHSITLGQECDISHIAELGWYEWVRFYDSVARFPDPKEVYGRWLGPSADVGPVMCAKILKKNGQVVVVSTYRAITEDEKNDPAHRAERDAFDEAIAKKLGCDKPENDGPAFTDSRTPEHELYSDDFEGTNQHIPDIDDVTPEEFDNTKQLLWCDLRYAYV